MHFIRSWLYVGKYRETLDQGALEANGIGAMLQMAELVEQPGIDALFLPVDDGIPIPGVLLREGMDFVRERKSRGDRVLVACGAGVSRSVAFCIGALKEEEGVALLDAFRDIQQKHPDALPHVALWESLCSYYQENVTFEELLG